MLISFSVRAALLCATFLPLAICAKQLPADLFSADPGKQQIARVIANEGRSAIERTITDGGVANLRGDKGLPLLVWALLNENRVAFTILLEKGADANVVDASIPHDSRHLLSMATQLKDDYWIRELLSHGANVNKKSLYLGQSAVYFAISKRRGSIVQLLAKTGIDFSQKNDAGYTPALFAAMNNDFESAFLLLQAGAPIDQRSKSGKTVGDYVAEYEKIFKGRGPKDAEKWVRDIKSFIDEKRKKAAES